MAETIKILGQACPTLITYYTPYIVPAGKSAVISSITICNTTSSEAKIRVHIVPSVGGEGLSNALYYELPIPAYDTLTATLGITMATGDFIRIYSNLENVCFQVFGSEIDV